MNYIVLSDVQNYLDITLTQNGQNLCNALIPNLQDMVDQYCNRSWNITNPITEDFDAFRDGKLQDTFFPKFSVDPAPYNNSFPQAGGIRSVTVGKVNGQGGVLIDLTFVYNYQTHIKFWSWNLMTNMFNPFGYRAVEIVYNSDDAGNVPNPIKQALIEWVARKIKTSMNANKETLMAQADTVKMQYVKDATPGMPDFVKLVLDQYRMPVLDHL